MSWSVRRVTEEDIPYLIKNIRRADGKEIKLSSGNSVEDALWSALQYPNYGIWVGVYQGNPEIIFGVGLDPDPSVGHPWMVCTDKLKDSPREFIKQCRTWVQVFSHEFPLLINYVHAENDLHIRWLKWCGFEFIKLHEKYGVGQEPFWEFRMERK